MPTTAPLPGRFLANDPFLVTTEGAAWSPRLRLAHRWSTENLQVGRVRHLDDWELFLQLEGTTWLWCAALGGAITVPPGALAVIPPGAVHAYGEIGRHLAVHADLCANPALEALDMLHHHGQTCESPSILLPGPGWIKVQGTECSILDLPLICPPRPKRRWEARLAPLIAQYATRTHRHAPARLAAAGIIAGVFADLAAEAADLRQDSGDPARQVPALIAAVAADPLRPWPLPLLVHRTGLGETALRAAWRRQTGLTPRAHIEALRLERAVQLLSQTSQSIAAIAEACGYPDAFHFSRVFSRRYGRSPQAWRQGGGR